MKLNWYINRLASMSLPEIFYRVRQAGSVALEKQGVLTYHVPPIDDVAVWETFRTGRNGAFFFVSDQRERLLQSYQSTFALKPTLSAADRLIDQQIELFGRLFSLRPTVDWHRDYRTGKRWPDAYWSDIDIRDGRTVGGVKWVWELNRHHHLVTLAKAYFLTGDEVYAEEACRQWESWLAQNPPGRGVNWTSSLEMALRIINWSWALAFLRGAEALQRRLFAQLTNAVYAQATYISRHLSRYSSANNHLVGEGSGLLFAGVCFPWFKESAAWRDNGLRIVNEQIALQIFPDGTPAEQTIEYLTFLLDFNFQTLRLARLNNLPVSPVWTERLPQVATFIRSVLRSDGSFPAIGDGDDAWVVRLDETGEQNRLRSFLAAIALELDQQNGVPFRDEKSFWLFGESAVRNPITPLPVSRSICFPNGGLILMRHGETMITFDCGPLGYLQTAAHGHADALSVTLSLGDTPLLIDPNTYAYQEGYAWRDYFRSSAAHNTVVVDGQDQSEMQGAFLWGRKAESTLLVWETAASQDRAIAAHNGYTTLGVTHQREVQFDKPNTLSVTDTLQGETRHSVALYWHFPAGATVEKNGGGVLVRVETAVMKVALERPDGWAIAIISGEVDPIQGWASPNYGVKVPAPVLCLSGSGRLPLMVRTRFEW